MLDFGVYCDGELSIKVYAKDGYLKYEVYNKGDEILFCQDMNISIYQRWGLFLDNNKNLWVFSSDVGHCIWERDSGTGRYRKRTFYHQLSKDEVPEEIYESTLRRFLKLQHINNPVGAIR